MKKLISTLPTAMVIMAVLCLVSCSKNHSSDTPNNYGFKYPTNCWGGGAVWWEMHENRIYQQPGVQEQIIDGHQNAWLNGKNKTIYTQFFQGEEPYQKFGVVAYHKNRTIRLDGNRSDGSVSAKYDAPSLTITYKYFEQ